MSEFYKKYQKLKEQDKEMMYLFKIGNFYIFLAEDADIINEYIVLKKTFFCKEAMKCGFPKNSLEEYMKVFHNHGLKIQIVDDSSKKNIDDALVYLRKINLDNITPVRALNLLYELKGLL